MIPHFDNITKSGISVINDLVHYSPRALKARETTIARAQTLWDDGYTANPVGFHAPGVYEVTVPPAEVEVDKKTGEVYDKYFVDLKTATCNCAGFGWMGTCKHLLAIQWRVAEYYNFLAPMYSEALGKTPALPAPDLSPAVAVPCCPKCSSSHLIPLDDFPGTSVCVGCTHIIEPDAPAEVPPPTMSHSPARSVIHANDFD